LEDKQMHKALRTWAGKSRFSYEGSVDTGTEIRYGKRSRVTVSGRQYSALLEHFKGRTVPIGTSRDRAPYESVGAWLQAHVTQTAIASYVGPILVEEGYAERVPGDTSRIRFK
jgi:hypothetical protein